MVFSEAVSDFLNSDVTLSGTAGATTAVITYISADYTTYNIAVSGMTGEGTVIASVVAGVAHDSAGNLNDRLHQYRQPCHVFTDPSRRSPHLL